MPAQQGVGLHQEDRPAVTIKHTRQRREDRPVGRFEAGSWHVSVQNCELMTQHKNLGILGPVPATAQHQRVDEKPNQTVEAGHLPILIDPTGANQIETRNPRSRHQTSYRHPQGGARLRKLLSEGRERELADRMSDALARITRAFAPRPVVYRTIDFRSNEFHGLDGGDEYEPVEANPMIGYRGCYRYVRETDLFRLELDVLARVRDETPNLHLMIPFVRTRWELEACLELVDASPLGRQRGMHRWVMAEVPSVVYRIPEYAALGIDGVSIGSNDLTQLVLGADRDSEICSELFDESDEAVLDAIAQIISSARAAGITSSLCGQAPSNRQNSPNTSCGTGSRRSR
jgi:phosphoenolpyruvate synthase/pyruvate phosphate dikinase